jgi:hypothetical protein
MASYSWAGFDPQDYGKTNVSYEPHDFKEAAIDIASACRTLETVSVVGRLGRWQPHLTADRTALISRTADGDVANVKVCSLKGRVIGKEDDWPY